MASQSSLPRQPLYQWFYDGGKTRKLIEWLNKAEQSIGDIDLGNPELTAILIGMDTRIETLETAAVNEPKMERISEDLILSLFNK